MQTPRPSKKSHPSSQSFDSSDTESLAQETLEKEKEQQPESRKKKLTLKAIKERLGITTQIGDMLLVQATPDMQPVRLKEMFRFKKVLGQGAFGVVIKVERKDPGEGKAVEAALKIISKKQMSSQENEVLKNEALILRQMDHKNIVKFFQIFETQDFMFIEMEVVKGGSLKKLMQSKREFSDLEASQIIRALLGAVEHVHLKNYVHRDLKPDNILIASYDDISSVKLADFGLSASYRMSSDHSLTEKMGTLLYMAPEQTSHQIYGKRIDMWASGIITYMLIEGKHPLYDSNDNETSFLAKLRNPQWSFSSNFSPLAKDFFLKLCNTSHLERYSSEQALKHPWITRDFSQPIPLTRSEQIREFQSETNLRFSVNLLYFLSISTPQRNTCMQDYLDKCRKFAQEVNSDSSKETATGDEQTWEDQKEYKFEIKASEEGESPKESSKEQDFHQKSKSLKIQKAALRFKNSTESVNSKPSLLISKHLIKQKNIEDSSSDGFRNFTPSSPGEPLESTLDESPQKSKFGRKAKLIGKSSVGSRNIDGQRNRASSKNVTGVGKVKIEELAQMEERVTPFEISRSGGDQIVSHPKNSLSSSRRTVIPAYYHKLLKPDDSLSPTKKPYSSKESNLQVDAFVQKPDFLRPDIQSPLKVKHHLTQLVKEPLQLPLIGKNQMPLLEEVARPQNNRTRSIRLDATPTNLIDLNPSQLRPKEKVFDSIIQTRKLDKQQFTGEELAAEYQGLHPKSFPKSPQKKPSDFFNYLDQPISQIRILDFNNINGEVGLPQHTTSNKYAPRAVLSSRSAMFQKTDKLKRPSPNGETGRTQHEGDLMMIVGNPASKQF